MSKPFFTNVATHGNLIYYRGIDNGRRVQRKIPYAPTLFVPSKSTNTTSTWKDLQGNAVEPMKFMSINDARDFIRTYKDVEGFTIYGQQNFATAFIAEQHPEEIMEWDIAPIVTAFIDIEVDTEHGMPNVDHCKNPVTAITVKFSNDPEYYVFGYGNYKPHRSDIHWLHCKDEYDLLMTFLQVWWDKSPDIVTGWSVKTFDIPYLVGRICATPELGEEMAKKLSPWGKVTRREEKSKFGKPITTYRLLGVSTLDYFQLYNKYAPKSNQESYKLDYIAHVELGERKVNYEEYETLHNLYRDNYQKFIEYNIHDVELVEKLNAKGRLIDMAVLLAYDNKTNYEDAFYQVRMWDAITYNHLSRKGIVIPPKKEDEKEEAYEGAYVKDPQTGLFEWLMSLDLDSLYPHLIMQYNMSPETLIEPEHYTKAMRDVLSQGVSVNALLQKRINLDDLEGCTLTPNGQFFDTTKVGFLAEIMNTMYAARVNYKNKQLELEIERETCADEIHKKELGLLISKFKNLQLAKKVGLNSAYGAMGSEYFRFFDIRIAEGVTLAGQLGIRWIGDRLNKFLNGLLKTTDVDYVIASDTDSVYLHLAPLVYKVFKDTSDTNKVIDFLDKVFKEKIKGMIETNYAELATYTHAYAQKMRMKRESLANKGIWTAKKRYILNVWDSEGIRYKKPKMVIHGLEAIKSSTPGACREKIKESLTIILNGTESELIDHIEKFRSTFKTLPIAAIAFPRGMNDLETSDSDRNAKSGSLSFDEDESIDRQIYNNRTPIHVKGALVYNRYLKQMNLDTKYETLRSGEKLKFVYLKEPNVFRESVMSFLVRVPKEFHLETCVDYDLMFTKAFLDPLNIVLDSIGWHSERTSSLEDFFG